MNFVCDRESIMKFSVLIATLTILLSACASKPLSNVSAEYRGQMMEVCQQHYLKKGMAADKVASGCDSSLSKYLDKIDESFEESKPKYQRRCRSETDMAACLHNYEKRHWQRYIEKYEAYISKK